METTINSRQIWVDTGLILTAGETYEFRATGKWKDASIDNIDAGGYESRNFFQRLTERLRRVPQAKWFALIGAIDRRKETQFVIGTGRTIRASSTGQLTCFANDLRGFYFNNSGGIVLSVEKR